MRPAELFLAEQWDALTVPKSYARLYACRCDLWECVQWAQSIDHKREFANDPHVDWACAGHPVPELPRVVGDLLVAAETDWDALVARVLDGTCPQPLRLHPGRPDGPDLWLRWLYAYLLGLDAGDALSRALAKRTGDPDPLVHGRVLHFFKCFPRAAGVDRLLDHAERSLDGLTLGYAIPEEHKPPMLFEVLVARLERAARPRDAVTLRALKVLRGAFLAPRTAASGIDLLPVALDSPSIELWDEEGRLWLADHAVALDVAGPGRWRPLLDLLADRYRKPALGHFIVVAGTGLVLHRRLTAGDFREWLDGARLRGVWVDAAWVQPLQTLLDGSVG